MPEEFVGTKVICPNCKKRFVAHDPRPKVATEFSVGEAPRPPEAKRYIVRGARLENLGPCTIEKLEELYVSGRIDDGDQIAEYKVLGISNGYVPLAQLPGFAVRLRAAREEAARVVQETKVAEQKQKEASYTVGPRRWHYMMKQVPRQIQVQEGTQTGGIAATFLSEIVEHQAARGWEFFRVDEIGVQVNPGCLAALFGATTSHESYFVVTFRREA